MDKSERKLWELYKKTKRKELLEKIVEKYLYIVKIITYKLKNYSTPNMDKDDFYSAGLVGLLQAIERFDLSKGFEFTTYASTRIRGEIIDEIRRTDWVPRSVRSKIHDINSVIDTLKNRNGYPPTDGEIATEMEISLDDYYSYTKSVGPLFLKSLNSEISTNNSDGRRINLIDMLKEPDHEDDEKLIQLKKIRQTVVDAISSLGEKEKLAVSLYYYEDLNLKEIALVMDVTEARVSQIHSSALVKLRKMVKDNFKYINF